MTHTLAEPHWEQHLQLLFGVLASVSIAQSLSLVTSSQFDGIVSILCALVLFIVLDSWYYLHRDLAVIDLDSPLSVITGALSLIAMSCLPFLFLVSAENRTGLEPPEWMIINLILICTLDAAWKAATLIAARPQQQLDASIQQREIWGKFYFFALSDLIYAIILLAVLIAFITSNLTPIYQAYIVGMTWIAIRGTDITIVPRIRNFFFCMLVGSR